VARIIVVDDESDIRTLIAEILTEAGHIVFECAEGRSALRVLDEQSPDLVITDILMPGMEGLETIRTMRATHPHVRIVAMTGGGMLGFDYLKAARIFGADEILRKPFCTAELREVVSRVLKQGASSGGIAAGDAAARRA
jgi:CheY-like chemotaxis protein